jgi:hypothetical protein
MEQEKMQEETNPLEENVSVEIVVKEKKKRQKREKSILIGNKQQVWDGLAEITGGKLRKEDLMECAKTKKIISKKKHLSGLALMDRAKKARENPDDPLHQKFVSFFEHQYKKKPKDITNEEEKPKKQRKNKKSNKKEEEAKVDVVVQVDS